jgi:hypothetical protein
MTKSEYDTAPLGSSPTSRITTITITIRTMLSRTPLLLQSLKAPTRTSFKRFNSSVPGGGFTGRNYIIPLGVAGIAGGAYYFYRSGVETPVAAAIQPSKSVLTNSDEWIDFKVESASPDIPPLQTTRVMMRVGQC